VPSNIKSKSTGSASNLPVVLANSRSDQPCPLPNPQQLHISVGRLTKNLSLPSQYCNDCRATLTVLRTTLQVLHAQGKLRCLNSWSEDNQLTSPHFLSRHPGTPTKPIHGILLALLSRMPKRMMIYANEIGGISKEKPKRRRGASSVMNTGATSSESYSAIRSESGTSWIKWMTLLRRG
jgi:hypothetical protein